MSDKAIRDALHLMPYAFYSLGSHTEDDDNLMVCNWVTQASFEPQLIAVALQKTAYSYGLVEKGGVFTINILRKEDEEVIKPLAKSRHKNPDKMKEAAYSPAPQTQCPVLDAAAAFLECKVVGKLDVGGDHNIILGEVVNAEVRKPGEVGDSLTLQHIGWSYAG